MHAHRHTPVRILIYQDYLRVGGTESQTVFLSSQFREHGHEVVVLTNRPGGALFPTLMSAGIRHESLQRWDTWLDWFAPLWSRSIAKFAPELVLLMGRNANRMGWRIREKHPQVRLVATMRTGRRLTGDYLRTLRVADRVFCNSKWAAGRLERQGIAAPRIEVHPNACLRGEALLQHPGPCSDSRQHDSSEREVTLLCVAAFVPGKNHRELLEWLAPWLKRRKNIRLLLVGEGPERRRIEKKVALLDLGRQVHFTGFVRDMAALYSQADLAILASLEESMPNALIEAQYAGLPVVALDVAGVGECLVDGKTGFLVKVGDSHQFIAYLDQLLSDDELRTSMAEKAREFARATFDPNQKIRLLLDSLREVIQSAGR